MASTKILYEGINEEILPYVSNTASCILDVGCGTGELGKRIKQLKACKVVGVTFSQEEANIASKNLDSVLIYDINNYDFTKLGMFDLIICSHILEHLYRPEEVLQKLQKNLIANGIVIVALPNILQWKQRLRFFTGKFKDPDETHIRFFDWESASELLTKSGLKILERRACGNFPLPGIRKLFPSISKMIDNIALKIYPGLFGSQFIIVGKKVH